MNKGFIGLERHGGVINDRVFIFGWTVPLSWKNTIEPSEKILMVSTKNTI